MNLPNIFASDEERQYEERTRRVRERAEAEHYGEFKRRSFKLEAEPDDEPEEPHKEELRIPEEEPDDADITGTRRATLTSHQKAERAMNKQVFELDRIAKLTGADLFEAEYTRAAQRSFIQDDAIIVNGERVPYTLNPNRGQTTSGLEAEARRERYAAYLEANQYTRDYEQHEERVWALLETVADLRGIEAEDVYGTRNKETVTKGSIRSEDFLPNKIAEMLAHPDVEQHYADVIWVKEMLKARKSPTFDMSRRSANIDTTPFAAYADVDDEPHNSRSGIVGMTPDIGRYFVLLEALESGNRTKLAIAKENGFEYEKALDRWMANVEQNVLIDLYTEDSDETLYAGPDDVPEPLHAAYLDVLADEHLRDVRLEQEREQNRLRDDKPVAEMTPKERRNKRDRDRRNSSAIHIVRRTPTTEAITA